MSFLILLTNQKTMTNFSYIIFQIGRSLISSFTSQWPKIQLSPESPNEFQQPLNQQQQQSQQRPSQYERQERRAVSPGTPLDWLLENKSTSFSKLLVDVRDANLPQRVIDLVGTLEEKSGDADCLKLLVCKSAPFVAGMQRAISGKLEEGDDGTAVVGSNEENEIDDDNVNNSDSADDADDIKDESMMNAFFKFLPDLNEFRKNSDLCETKYNNCTIFSK